MTTPTPADIATGVPWEVFLPVVTGLLGAFGVTVRLIYKAFHRRLDDKTTHNHELVVQLEGRVSKYFEAHERLRDKWDEFLREYLKIDSTRGQKVDALFRVNDQMQKVVDSIPRHVDSKIEEAFTHSLSELKLYIRELMAKERSDAR
jgi:hypothetical protein